MPPNEPSAADIAAVAATMGGAPAPQPQQQPAQQPQQQQPQMQPEAPTPQPAPSQQQTDPFQSLFASEPTAPTEPQAQPQNQPVEPTQTPQPTQTPTEPSQPTPQEPTTTTSPKPETQQAPAQAPPADDYQTFDEYMTSITAGVPKATEQPDPSKINPDDPNAIKGFFDDLINTAVQRASTETQKSQAIQSAEKKAWDGAFDKYGSLKSNKPLRDMVHNIRMGYFNRGVAITPTQAADKLLDAMKGQYQKGVADNQVHTTIESVQPQGGGTGQPVPTTLDKENVLTRVQTGGETALAEILDAEIKAGRL